MEKRWQISGSRTENKITAFTRLPDLHSDEVRTQLYTKFNFNSILPSTPKYRVWQFCDWHSYFVFGRSQDEISAQKLAITALECRSRKMLESYLKLGGDRFLPSLFQLIFH
jgi:hypothetical protein